MPLSYKNDQLHIEALPIEEIAKKVETPFYAYAATSLEESYKAISRAMSDLPATICYAVKANSNLAVIKTFANLGAGADIVSEGEMRRALAAGVPPHKIVFSGVGKTPAEIEAALIVDVAQFNVESEPELQVINDIATKLNKKAPVSIRVNPDVDAGTHSKISTGRKEDKFGIDWHRAPQIVKQASSMSNIEFKGLAVHIGSQLTTLDPFRASFLKLKQLATEIRQSGIDLQHLDLGGGLGITYKNETPPPINDYAALVHEIFGDFKAKLFFEPGRWLVGNAGVLVTKVLYVKQGENRKFAIVDAGMNDMMRQSLYDAFHDITAVKKGASTEKFDVVGPVCETSCIFARQIKLPAIKPGDLLVIHAAGAYGSSMASTYNSRLLIPEILVKKDTYAVIRPRPTYQQMLDAEKIPDWL